MHFLQYFTIFSVIYNCKSHIINNRVVQIVDVQTQLVKITTTINLTNVAKSPTAKIYYAIDPDVKNYAVEFESSANTPLTFNNKQVILDKPLMCNESAVIKMNAVYLYMVAPLYKKRYMNQNQVVLFKGNTYFYSPYHTQLLEKHYSTKSDQVENLTYTFSGIPPYKYKEFSLIIETDTPFFVVDNLKRIVDVSHYGRICVTHEVDLENKGSGIAGPYMPQLRQLQSNLYMYLPAAAQNVQLFDHIGNNSKSTLVHNYNSTTLQFQTRYPLFGGWKTFYVVKYCVPAYNYLENGLDDLYVLKIRLLDHVLNDVIIKRARIEIILPELSDVQKIEMPASMLRFGFETRKSFTSLCFWGRPTVTVKGVDLLENHIDWITVEYSYPKWQLLQMPLILVAYIECVFLFVICIVHLK